MPPVVAIALAILTRRAALSLVVGIFFGALVTTGGNPFTALHDTLEVHLWPTLVDEEKMRVFSFTLLMGAMVGIVCRSGGMQGLVDWISPRPISSRPTYRFCWVWEMERFVPYRHRSTWVKDRLRLWRLISTMTGTSTWSSQTGEAPVKST